MNDDRKHERTTTATLQGRLRGETGGFRGELVFPDSPGYDAARRVWNAAIDCYPAVVVRCASREDVATALRLARRHDLPVAVRGGGHSFAGHSTCDGGVVIDLSRMKRVTVDARRRVALVEPGLTWGELTEATQAHGLAPVGGHVSTVGVAGLTLGGGVGWLARKHGLACDNLVEAELITAGGSVVRAGAGENPELFWGLRGGGGNFGIATRLTLRLHPVGTLFAGMVIHPRERAPEVLRFFRDFTEAAPDSVNVMAGLITAPPEPFVPPALRGRPAVLLAGCYVGPVEEGGPALAPLWTFGSPPVDLFGPTPYGQLQKMFDAMAASLPVCMKSELLGSLDDAALDKLVEHTETMPSPTSSALVVPLGGAVQRVPPDATAFAHRGAHYNLEVGAAWTSADENSTPYRRWAESCWRAIRPWSAGVEINHLGDEGARRVREAYGERGYARLAALKRAYDPDNVFRLNQNIAPAGGGPASEAHPAPGRRDERRSASQRPEPVEAHRTKERDRRRR